MEIEEITKKIEAENDFTKLVDLFAAAAKKIEAELKVAGEQKGRLYEIIRELDGVVERVCKLETPC